EPVLNDRPSTPNEALIAQLRARPVIDRVGELFAVKSPGDARMEWQELAKKLDTQHRTRPPHPAAAYRRGVAEGEWGGGSSPRRSIPSIASQPHTLQRHTAGRCRA